METPLVLYVVKTKRITSLDFVSVWDSKLIGSLGLEVNNPVFDPIQRNSTWFFGC